MTAGARQYEGAEWRVSTDPHRPPIREAMEQLDPPLHVDLHTDMYTVYSIHLLKN